MAKTLNDIVKDGNSGIKVCEKCGKKLSDTQFYTYKDGRKTEMCKKCLTMHIDNFDESTYVWLLEKMDVPYLPPNWNKLRDSAFARNPNLNGMSVFGKYLSQMKLKQYKEYGYADSERAMQELYGNTEEEQKPIDPEFEEKMKIELKAGKISKSQYQTLVSTKTQYQDAEILGTINPPSAQSTFYDESNFISEDEIPDPAEGLTQEDKVYLAVKWGRLYKPNEWIELEKKYKEMTEFFGVDESDSDTIGTLILICKTYLKMNQAIDVGDMDGFQKLSRVYDTLRKSAKFTAAQNKDKNGGLMTSVGELVNWCEKEGGAIPRYEIKEPLDRVDKIINDLKAYNKSLIYSDTTLAAQIEDYLKQRTILDQKRAEREGNGGHEVEITNEDYEQYFDQIQDELDSDMEVYKEI